MTARKAPQWLTDQTYAHRGLHSFGVPENSRTAAEVAIASGFGIECDIQMSKDNVPIVFHDWELDRLTEARGKVANLSAEELCKLTLAASQDRIWTLADLLRLVDGQVPLLIEIKSLPHFAIAEACAAIARVLDGYNGEFAVMSFDPRMGEWFTKHSPRYWRGLVATDTLDHGFINAWRRPHAIERAQPDFLAADIRDLPNALSDLWRAADKPLLTWTVRTRELRERASANADAPIAEGDGLG
ncbi:MAG: glycerophosphodiester phosphodiesterase family protein [Pseudomonadota bacterium]